MAAPRAGACSQNEVLVEGNVASGENDSGDPIKVAGVFNTTLPTLADGSRVDLQTDVNGRLLTSPDDKATAAHTADNTITNASETILAANTARKGFIVQNVGTANLRVRLDGGVATTTNGIQLTPGQFIQMVAPFVPTTALTAIREGASDSVASVVELS